MKHAKPIWLITIGLIVVIGSCKKKPLEQEYIQRVEVLETNASGAVFSAKLWAVDREDIDQVGFVWSEDKNPATSASRRRIESDRPNLDGIFTLHATTGIKLGITYYLSAYVVVNGTTYYSQPISFFGRGSNGLNYIGLVQSEATWGDTLRIRAHDTDFYSENNMLAVYMDGIETSVVFSNREEIRFIVPDEVFTKYPEIKLSVNGSDRLLNTEKHRVLTMKRPIADSISSELTFAGDTITIYGNNFCPIPHNNHVYFIEEPLEVLSSSRHHISFKAPVTEFSSSGGLSVYTFDNMYEYFYIRIQKHFKRLRDFPGAARYFAIGQTLNGDGYAGLGHLAGHEPETDPRDIWKYEPQTDSWTQQTAQYPKEEAFFSFPIQANGKLLLTNSVPLYDYGIQSRQWYELSSTQSKWEKEFSWDDRSTFILAAFAIDDDIYAVSVVDDGPVELLAFLDGQWTSRGKLTDFNYNSGTFVLNGKCYFVSGISYSDGYANNTVRVYDPKTNRWSILGEFPGQTRTFASGFTINGKGYIAGGIMGGNEDIWEYNADTDQWIKKEEMVSKANFGQAVFVLNNKAYFVAGGYSVGLHTTKEVTNEVWEYTAY